MRVLGITETCDLGALYLRLIAEGHEVRVSVSEPLAAGTMAGLVPRCADWRAELDWIREAGRDGLLMFEAVGFGALQDALRADGLQVIGGSAFGDRLEDERAFALGLLESQAVRLAPLAEFDSGKAALDDLAANPRRCVFKRSASAGDTFVGMMDDGRDVAALLRAQPPDDGERFVLMDHVAGVETGVGAFFNGDRFMAPVCLDWEHKRFFAGDMGELTGEMGTVATYDGADAIFAATLLPLEPMLRAAGHVGWVNLNTIINQDGIWPIEFTCRFGYPGFAVLEPLQALGWGELLGRIVARRADFPVRAGFSLGVVLTTPPFPYSRHEIAAPVGLPILAEEVEEAHLHWGEVGLAGDGLVTAGLYGWTAVVTGCGANIADAKAAAYRRAARVRCSNLRYRLDIGDAMTGALDQLAAWGWLKSMPSMRMASQIVR